MHFGRSRGEFFAGAIHPSVARVFIQVGGA